MEPGVGAIRAAFFLGLGLTLGCQPDLSRESGALEVLWYGVDPTATLLRASVRHEDTAYQVEADPRVAARLSVESVPAGPLTVLGESLVDGVVLQSRIVSGEVPANGLATVVINLAQTAGDGGIGPGPIETGWLSAPFTFLKPDQDVDLTVAGRVEAAVSSVVAGAESQLGTIHAARVSGLRIDLLGSSTINELDRVWSGELTVGLRPAGGGGLVTIGQGRPPNAATFQPTLTQDALISLIGSLRSGQVEVVLSGLANSSGSDGSVDAKVSLKFTLE